MRKLSRLLKSMENFLAVTSGRHPASPGQKAKPASDPSAPADRPHVREDTMTTVNFKTEGEPKLQKGYDPYNERTGLSNPNDKEERDKHLVNAYTQEPTKKKTDAAAAMLDRLSLLQRMVNKTALSGEARLKPNLTKSAPARKNTKFEDPWDKAKYSRKVPPEPTAAEWLIDHIRHHKANLSCGRLQKSESRGPADDKKIQAGVMGTVPQTIDQDAIEEKALRERGMAPPHVSFAGSANMSGPGYENNDILRRYVHPRINKRITVPALYRSYKHTPHDPHSVLLKFAVHRIANRHKYAVASPADVRKMDEDWLKFHQQGKAAEKNGTMTVDHLHHALQNNPGIIVGLLKHQRDLHRKLYEFSGHNIKSINGVPCVALTRGLNVKPGEEGPDHSLASYADVKDTGFGTHMHHRWVPVDNIWHSYDLGSAKMSSECHGAENEYLVSPHQHVKAEPSDIKQLAPRELYKYDENPNNVIETKPDSGVFEDNKLARQKAIDEFKLGSGHPSITPETVKLWLNTAAQQPLAEAAMASSILRPEDIEHHLSREVPESLNNNDYAEWLRSRLKGLSERNDITPGIIKTVNDLANVADRRQVGAQNWLPISGIIKSNPEAARQLVGMLKDPDVNQKVSGPLLATVPVPDDVFSKYVKDPVSAQKIGENPNLTEQQQIRLVSEAGKFGDARMRVYEQLIRNERLSPDAIRKMNTDGPSGDYAETMLVAHPNTPTDVLSRLIRRHRWDSSYPMAAKVINALRHPNVSHDDVEYAIENSRPQLTSYGAVNNLGTIGSVLAAASDSGKANFDQVANRILNLHEKLKDSGSQGPRLTDIIRQLIVFGKFPKNRWEELINSPRFSPAEKKIFMNDLAVAQKSPIPAMLAKSGGPAEPPAGPHVETPRDAANEQTTAELAGQDYKFARKSKIGNKGEDVARSARHKVNEWKGIGDAESAGTAADLVTRDKLMKLSPHNLADKVTEENWPLLLGAHLAMTNMPAKPTVQSTVKTDDPNAVVWHEFERGVPESQEGVPGSKNKKMWLKPGAESIAGPSYVKKRTWTMGEASAHSRKRFVEMFDSMKGRAEQLGAMNVVTGSHPGDVPVGTMYAQSHPDLAMSGIMLMRNHAVNLINKIKDEHLYSGSHGAPDMGPVNGLIHFYNRAVNPFKKTGATQDLKKFWAGMLERHGADWERTAMPQAAEYTKRILAGEKVGDVFGSAGSSSPNKKKKFDPVEAYMSHAERVGPEHGLNDPELQNKFLLLMGKMRGLQWGNSVSDAERQHHLMHASNALKDLTTTLGLPDEMASINGRLALAVGARGHGRALAHYEPDLRVINLTRKGGVGSLAHEWGHAFDNMVHGLLSGQYEGKEKKDEKYHPGYLSEDSLVRPDDEHAKNIQAAMDDITKVLRHEVRPRMNHDVSESPELVDRLSPNWRSYWFSGKEMFARAFEKYMEHKLAGQNLKNTYLTGTKEHILWPSFDETRRMAPLFDKLFTAFKASPHLKKSKQPSRLENDLEDPDERAKRKGRHGAGLTDSTKVLAMTPEMWKKITQGVRQSAPRKPSAGGEKK